jgi:hypothetical protein
VALAGQSNGQAAVLVIDSDAQLGMPGGVLNIGRASGFFSLPGTLVAALMSLGAVSLPGTVSYVSSVAPVCAAIGAPTAPLGLLVAVETLPDIMRTLGNVTMNVAVTSAVDRAAGPGEASSHTVAT